MNGAKKRLPTGFGAAFFYSVSAKITRLNQDMQSVH